MNQFLISVIDFFLPRLCVSCESKLSESEDSICEKCYSEIKITSPQFLKSEFERKFADEAIITDFVSLFIFEEDSPLKKLMHSLKYGNKFKLGSFIGKNIGAVFDQTILEWQPDLLIPVPLHRLKKAERGFNQSLIISKALSKIIKIDLRSNILVRKRYTSTQTKLNISERKLNIGNAFSIKNKKSIKGKNIILLDDVITTGATISECAKLLKNSGAGKIYAVSAAIAEKN